MAAAAKNRLAALLLFIAVFLAVALPRWLIVAQSATADETKWVARAANFSTALSEGDLANTYQSEHPGVTTMWAGTLGLKAIFSDYAAQNPGQLAPHELDQFLFDHGRTPLQALASGRQVMVLFNALTLTLVLFYAWKLLDLQTALLAALFSALAPFFAALTQLMHLDGLAGSLMLLSLMAFLSYANRLRKRDLLLSGIAAGLAWLTKTPAFALGPILLLLAFLSAYGGGSRTAPDKTALRRMLLACLAWLFIGLLTFFIVWPAMWVEPLGTLERIFGEALNYAAGGHGDPIFFNGVIYPDGRIPTRIFYFYPLTYLWRSTPVVLAGLLLAIPALWHRWSPLDRRAARFTMLALFLYALLFTLFMTLGDKKFDRYLIPTYPALHIIAAAGWVSLLRSIIRRYFSQGAWNVPARRNGLLLLFLGLLVAWQLVALTRVFPYPLSYYNPLLGGSERAPQVMQIGWGEGLDAAGRTLREKPGSEQLIVASWYRSVLAYHFNGATISIKAELTPEEAAAIQTADYAVIYIHQWQRNAPPDLLDLFGSLEPEHTIEINGLEYAKIYDLRP